MSSFFIDERNEQKKKPQFNNSQCSEYRKYFFPTEIWKSLQIYDTNIVLIVYFSIEIWKNIFSKAFTLYTYIYYMYETTSMTIFQDH